MQQNGQNKEPPNSRRSERKNGNDAIIALIQASEKLTAAERLRVYRWCVGLIALSRILPFATALIGACYGVYKLLAR